MTDDSPVRPADADDAAAIQRVARDAWHAAYDPVLDADRIDETVSSWYDPPRLVEDDIEPSDRPLFVAVADGAVVGFAEAVPDDGLAHLYRIYVAPDHWGGGIGGRLLARTERVLREQGFDRLQLSVLAANEVGVGFYESHGFTRTAETRNDHFGVEEYEYRKRL